MRTIIPLQKKWAFTKQTDTCPTEMPLNWNWVNLPHTWNDIDGQDGDNDYYRGIGWYARQLHKSSLPKAAHYYLEITGASASADVYLNGRILFHHDGGYSTFRVELTEYLQDLNLLVIAVDNNVNDTVYPQMADYTFYGGLYRQVNVICTEECHFDMMDHGSPGIQITPDVSGKVEIKTKVCGNCYDQIRFSILDSTGSLVCSSQTEQVSSFLTVKDPHLWNGRKDPYLYKAVAEVICGNTVVDCISTRFGFRSFQIDPQRGFILNGEEYPLRGVSRHQDRWGYGNALLPEHHREDMDLICEMGANTIRLAHYQHDQYFYDLCDERGMIVWAEIPYISRHMPKGRENTLSQMQELILQNYNHPSIVVWGLSNEITVGGESPDLLENHHQLHELCHQLDSTRPTVVAAVSMCPMSSPYLQIPDAVSYNHYFGWYGGDTSMNGPWFDKFHETYPHIPIGCSEYGCEALNWHSSDPQQGDYTEEYQAHYHEELIKQLFSRKYLWATHVWNMFDFGADGRNEGGENGQNHKGLVTFDRKYKKDAFYAYKAWLSDKPFVHICGKRYVDRVEEVTKVTVYSNQLKVELFANGVSLGVQESPDHFFYFNVPNQCPETKLHAVAGAYEDDSYIRKTDAFNETYRLREQGVLLNWFDITQPEGYFSLNDKISELLKSKEAAKYVQEVLSSAMHVVQQNREQQESFMHMVGGFTLLRLCNLLVQMQPDGQKLNRGQLLAWNEKLNTIPKAESSERSL